MENVSKLSFISFKAHSITQIKGLFISKMNRKEHICLKSNASVAMKVRRVKSTKLSCSVLNHTSKKMKYYKIYSKYEK